MRKRRRKLKVPQISPAAMTPQMAELGAFAEQLVKSVKEARAERQALRAERARLLRARRACARGPK
jgi:hypothetical protein